MNAMFMDVNNRHQKAANLMGFNCGSCRMPLCDMTEQDQAKLVAIMKNTT